jgi:hypothetical protein
MMAGKISKSLEEVYPLIVIVRQADCLFVLQSYGISMHCIAFVAAAAAAADAADAADAAFAHAI